jgi:hypothetical protein
MAKFIIPVEDLPPPDINGNHVFRFRILSEDRNRQSQYSTLYTIESTGQIFPLESPYEITSSGSVIGVYWETPSYFNVGASAVGASVLHNHESEWKTHPMDVFVSWDSGEYEYYGRTIDSDINIIKRSGASTLKIMVQMANHPPTFSYKFKIFETGNVAL